MNDEFRGAVPETPVTDVHQAAAYYNNKTEVDELRASWSHTGARIVSPPESKPWKLREFTAADLDGNLIRVFYDFGSEERRTP